MPCYEPPRPDVHDYREMTSQRDKYIVTIKEIEDLCREVLKIEPESRFNPTHGIAGETLPDGSPVIGSQNSRRYISNHTIIAANSRSIITMIPTQVIAHQCVGASNTHRGHAITVPVHPCSHELD